MTTRLLSSALAAAFLCSASPARAADACVDAAQNAYNVLKVSDAKQNITTGPACFVDPRGATVSLADPAQRCVGSPQILYSAQRDVLKEHGDPQRATKAETAACPTLFVVTRKADAPAPAGAAFDARELVRKGQLDALLKQTDAAQLLRGRLESADQLSLRSPTGQAALTGAVLTDAAAEALQILGQIVVDRASQAGYRLIARRAREGLGCERRDGKPEPQTRFPATCAALNSLRVQDIAMSRDVIVRAIASDVVGQALASYEPAAANAAGAKAAVQRLPERELAVLRSATSAAIGAISDGGTQRSTAVARAVVDELRSLAQSAVEPAGNAIAFDDVAPTLKPLALASAAVFACELYVADGKLKRLATCDVSREVDRLAKHVRWKGDETRAAAVASSVARSMQLFLDGYVSEAGDKPASAQRAVEALAGAFDATCYAVDRAKELGCPAILDVPAGQAAKVVATLSGARGALEAALERDTNRLIASVGRGLDQVASLKSDDDEVNRGRRRALRLIGGLAQYAQTFAETGETKGQKHEQRTKVLESLTADMTDRSGREGDWIWSLGGSLALTVGGRMPGLGGEGKAVFNGPLALTLGGALHKVPESGPGLHLEFGVIDLAQYLSFRRETDGGEAGARGEKSVVVRKPKVPDALAPSVKAGVQWGRDVPFYVAGYLQYAPFYEFEKNDGSLDRHGAFIIGAAAGAYVPFFDAN